MKLTPLDIHHKEFHRSIRGYNEEEVDLFLDQVYEEFERLFKENANFKEKIEKIESKITQYEGIEQTLQNTLLTAQKSAEEVQSNAKKEADLIMKDAEMQAKQILEDTYNQRRTLTNALNNLSAIEEEFISRLTTTIQAFNGKINELKTRHKEVERRINTESKKLPSIEIKAGGESEKIKEVESQDKPVEVKKETKTPEKTEAKTDKKPVHHPKKEETAKSEPSVQEVKVEKVVPDKNEKAEEKQPEPVAATLGSNEEVDKFMEGEEKKGGFLSRMKSNRSKKDTEDNSSKEKKKKKNTEEIEEI